MFCSGASFWSLHLGKTPWGRNPDRKDSSVLFLFVLLAVLTSAQKEETKQSLSQTSPKKSEPPFRPSLIQTGAILSSDFLVERFGPVSTQHCKLMLFISFFSWWFTVSVVFLLGRPHGRKKHVFFHAAVVRPLYNLRSARVFQHLIPT